MSEPEKWRDLGQDEGSLVVSAKIRGTVACPAQEHSQNRVVSTDGDPSTDVELERKRVKGSERVLMD